MISTSYLLAAQPGAALIPGTNESPILQPLQSEAPGNYAGPPDKDQVFDFVHAIASQGSDWEFIHDGKKFQVQVLIPRGAGDASLNFFDVDERERLRNSRASSVNGERAGSSKLSARERVRLQAPEAYVEVGDSPLGFGHKPNYDARLLYQDFVGKFNRLQVQHAGPLRL